MKRYLHAVAAAAILTCGLGSVGCASRTGVTLEDRYRNAVDVSWPDRYNYAARESVLAPFAQQVATGHFIDQTLWNFYFEPGSEKLTYGGVDKLDALARQTPGPDPKLYIQTARDIIVTPENIDKVDVLRMELNAKRAAVVKKYLTTEPGAPVPYEVYVHDAPVPGIYAQFAAAAFGGQKGGYRGGITAGVGSQGTGGGSMGQAPAPLTTTNVNNGSGGGGAPGGAAPGASPSGAP